MYPLSSDIGNRITELSKAVVRIHNDMKVVQQLLINDENVSKDALTQDGPSFLGKYITGAKNNFRGFMTGHESKSPSLTVTVHHEEGEVNKEKVDSKLESDIQENQAGECGADESQQVTRCDVMKMEEGRAKLEPGDENETETKEKVETGDSEDTDNKAKEEVVAGTSFNYAEEKLETEASQAEKDTFKVTITEQAETITDSNEKIDTKKLVKKFEDIELKEKNVEERWVKNRKSENNTAEQSVVMEVYEKPGAKKIIPSPTGSSSSQDTGFGSREGEGSIDGMLVSL